MITSPVTYTAELNLTANSRCVYTLKRKVDALKGVWVDELTQVLWTIRTAGRTSIGQTPFSMTYGSEAMSPVEVGLLSPRRLHLKEISNDELRRFELDFLEERGNKSQSKLAIYQRKITRYYNSKVKKKTFRINNLILWRVFLSTNEVGAGTLGSKWEGSYRVKDKIRFGTCRIKALDGKA